MRVIISGNTNEILERVAIMVGSPTSAVLKAVTGYAKWYLTDITRESLSIAQDGVSLCIPTMLALVVTDKASELDVRPGQVVDYLLRLVLPVIEFNPEQYKYIKADRCITKIDVVTYNRLKTMRDNDRTFVGMSVGDYLWIMIKDLTNEDIIGLFITAKENSHSYKGRQPISIEIPNSFYMLLSATVQEFNVPRFCLLSSFVDGVIDWLGQTVKELPKSNASATDPEAFRRLINFAFMLGQKE